MYLSKFTDYSFRMLIYLGNNQNKLFTIDGLSNTLNLSAHHISYMISFNILRHYIYKMILALYDKGFIFLTFYHKGLISKLV